MQDSMAKAATARTYFALYIDGDDYHTDELSDAITLAKQHLRDSATLVVIEKVLPKSPSRLRRSHALSIANDNPKILSAADALGLDPLELAKAMREAAQDDSEDD